MTSWIFGASGSIGQRVTESLLQRSDQVIAFTSNQNSASKLELELQGIGDLRTLGLDLQSDTAIEILSELAKEQEPKHIIYLARGPIALDSLSGTKAYGEMFLQDWYLSLVFPIKLSLALAKILDSKLQTFTMASSQYGLIAQNPDIYEDPSKNISTAYGSIRAGINNAVKSLAVQLGPRKIRVNAIALGGFSEGTPSFLKARISGSLPDGEMLNAQDAAGVFLFMASDSSSGMTGSTLVVDKGWTLK